MTVCKGMVAFEEAQADIRKLIDILCADDVGVSGDGFRTVLNVAKNWKIRLAQTHTAEKVLFHTELGEWNDDLLATILAEEMEDGEEAKNDSEAAGCTEDNAEGSPPTV